MVQSPMRQVASETREVKIESNWVSNAGSSAWKFCVKMKPTRFEVGVLVLIAAACIYQNFVPPLIGLADSGDFERVLPQAGLAHSKIAYDDKYFRFFNHEYAIVARTPLPGQYLTSSYFLIRAARWLSIASGRHEYFDMRVLAAIRLILMLLGIWLILIAARSLTPALRIVLAGLLILMFTDVGYVAYFNSFYSEAAALCFLLIAIGSALNLIGRRSSSPLLLAGYFSSVAFVETSKPQYVPLAPLFALFGIYLANYMKMRRRFWFAAGMALVLCGLTGWYYRKTPQVLRAQVAYLGIFSDLLPNSATPEQDLAEIGLKPEWAAYSGTTPYQEDTLLNTIEGQASFAKNITSYTLVRFYAAHPKRLFLLCERCVRHVFTDRIARLGYYEAETGFPPTTQGYGLWSTIRETLFPRSLIFVGMFIASGVPAFVLARKSKTETMRSMYLLYVLLVLIALVQFFVASLAQGEMDLAKHLFMFNLAFDACLILAVLRIVDLLQHRARWSTASRKS